MFQMKTALFAFATLASAVQANHVNPDTGVVTQVLSMTSGNILSGSISVDPATTYSVSVDILRNDLGQASEYVSSVVINGISSGHCMPSGLDYDCTFHRCEFGIADVNAPSGVVEVSATFQGHSWDCDCDIDSWQCFAENTDATAAQPWVLTQGFTGVMKVTLTPLRTVTQYIYAAGTGSYTDLSQQIQGYIPVVPGHPYLLYFDVLRNDLGSSNEKVSAIYVDGNNVGSCNPIANGPEGEADYSCDFWNCPLSYNVVSPDESILVEATFTSHSYDCGCDMASWDCNSEKQLTTGQQPMEAVLRVTAVYLSTDAPTSAPTTDAPTDAPTSAPTPEPAAAANEEQDNQASFSPDAGPALDLSPGDPNAAWVMGTSGDDVYVCQETQPYCQVSKKENRNAFGKTNRPQGVVFTSVVGFTGTTSDGTWLVDSNGVLNFSEPAPGTSYLFALTEGKARRL